MRDQGVGMQANYREMWEKFFKKLQESQGDNILCAILYDINVSEQGKLAVVLKDDSLDKVEEISILIKKLNSKLPTPFIFDKNYILESLDSFPLEFLNMSTDYEIMNDSDNVFSALNFKKNDVRLQAERELKGKILLIRTAFLENFSQKKELINLIKISFSSFIPVLKGLLFLLDQPIPKNISDIIDLADKHTEFSINSFHQANSIFLGTANKNDFDLSLFFKEYLKQLKELSRFIDRLDL